MTDYKSIFSEEKKKAKINIVIEEVNDAGIALGIRADIGFGQVVCNWESGSIKISIPESLSPEMKTRVLFHEYGHALHYLNLGPEEILQKRKNELQWLIESEFEALKYCLKKSKERFEYGDKEFLKNTVDAYKNRLVPYLNNLKEEYNKTGDKVLMEKIGYAEAMQNISEDDLWKDCVKLINKM